LGIDTVLGEECIWSCDDDQCQIRRSETAATKPAVKSCSILTTTPNAVTTAIHDRMPVILDPNNYDLWLDPGMTNVDAACDLL
jgi:putative SOS response-associated peptidase YedK